MATISKTFRINEKDYQIIKDKLKKLNMNFTEYARKSLINKKIYSKVEKVYPEFNYKLLFLSFFIGVFLMIALANTKLISYISFYPAVIKIDNFYTDAEDKHFFRLNKQDIIYNKNIAYIYLDK